MGEYVLSCRWSSTASFGLKFESTSTIQNRALAEFIAEWTPTPDEEIPESTLPGKETDQEWIMYFHGAFSLQGTGAGVLLVAPIGEHLKYMIHMHFPWERATNKTAEYEGLLPVSGSRRTSGSRNLL